MYVFLHINIIQSLLHKITHHEIKNKSIVSTIMYPKINLCPLFGILIITSIAIIVILSISPNITKGIDISGGLYNFPAFTYPFSQHNVGLKIRIILIPDTTQKIIFPVLSLPQIYILYYYCTIK